MEWLVEWLMELMEWIASYIPFLFSVHSFKSKSFWHHKLLLKSSLPNTTGGVADGVAVDVTEAGEGAGPEA